MSTFRLHEKMSSASIAKGFLFTEHAAILVLSKEPIVQN